MFFSHNKTRLAEWQPPTTGGGITIAEQNEPKKSISNFPESSQRADETHPLNSVTKFQSHAVPKRPVRLGRNFLRGTLLFDGQHDAVHRIFGLPTVSNRVWLPPKKNPSKIKRRFRGPITRKVRAPADNRQRRRNGHGRNAEELGRLDFSENRFAAITRGENRKRVKNLTVKKRKNAWHRTVYKAWDGTGKAGFDHYGHRKSKNWPCQGIDLSARNAQPKVAAWWRFDPQPPLLEAASRPGTGVQRPLHGRKHNTYSKWQQQADRPSSSADWPARATETSATHSATHLARRGSPLRAHTQASAVCLCVRAQEHAHAYAECMASRHSLVC